MSSLDVTHLTNQNGPQAQRICREEQLFKCDETSSSGTKMRSGETNFHCKKGTRIPSIRSFCHPGLLFRTACS
jgi:hypothetical protein